MYYKQTPSCFDAVLREEGGERARTKLPADVRGR